MFVFCIVCEFDIQHAAFKKDNLKHIPLNSKGFLVLYTLVMGRHLKNEVEVICYHNSPRSLFFQP